MLVLSRKPDEQIVIGNGIVVTVVEVRGDKVRLGIEAPREIGVHRREIYDAIKKENQDGSSGGNEGQKSEGAKDQKAQADEQGEKVQPH